MAGESFIFDTRVSHIARRVSLLPNLIWPLNSEEAQYLRQSKQGKERHMHMLKNDNRSSERKWWLRLFDAISNSLIEELLAYTVGILLLLGGVIVYKLFFG